MSGVLENQMSYKYQIGYDDYDGGGAFQLEHEQWFDKAALLQMIGEAAVCMIREELEAGKYHIHDFADIHHKLAGWLVEHKGFRNLEYTVNLWMDGSDSLFDKADIDRYSDDTDLPVIIDAVNAAGYGRWDDWMLLGDDIRILLSENSPASEEQAKQLIIKEFCADEMTLDGLMSRFCDGLSEFAYLWESGKGVDKGVKNES